MEFRKVSKEKIKEKFERSGVTRPHYLRADVPLYRPKEGDNFIRVLPPVGEMDDFGLDIWVHPFLGVERGSYLCLERTSLFGRKKQKCIICDFYRKVQNAERSGQVSDLVKALAPKRRTLFWVLDVSNKPQSADPLVFDAPYRQVAEEILMRCIDRRTGEIIDISDVKEGREVYFKMVRGNRKFPEYRGIELGKVYPIDTRLASKIVPLYEVVVIPDEVELMELIDVLESMRESPVVEEEISSQVVSGNNGNGSSIVGEDMAVDAMIRRRKRLLSDDEEE